LLASDGSWWGTAMSLPKLHELTLGLSVAPPMPGERLSEALTEAAEGDEIIVYIEPEGQWPSPLQFLSLPVLTHLEVELADNVIQALYAWYLTLFGTHDFLLEDEGTSDRLPRLSNPDDLRRLIRLNYVMVQPLPSVTPYLGLGFSCSWDEERGLGVMTYGAEVLEIGLEDTALSVSIARDHHEDYRAVEIAAIVALGETTKRPPRSLAAA
jgi:hypothetical protein